MFGFNTVMDWVSKKIAQSQLREADRLEAEAELLQRRAISLRTIAGIYFKVQEIKKLATSPTPRS